MSDFGFEFDPSTVEGGDNFDPIPDGTYSVVCKAAEVRPNKGGKGLNLQWSVTGPTHVGRVVFDMINIINASDRAQEIARQTLKSLCAATGLGKVQDSSRFVGAQCKIVVNTEKSEQYGDKNRVKRYLKGDAPNPTTTATPAASSEAKPPWA